MRAPGTLPNPPLNAYTQTHTLFKHSFLKIWFAEYFNPHTLFHYFPHLTHTFTLRYIASALKTRRFDLHEVLGNASLYLRSSVECACVCFVFSGLGVCWCVRCMLMWGGHGPWDQTEDDNPGGTLCGPANWASQMGGGKGSLRKLSTGGEGHHPPNLISLHFRFVLHRSSYHYETSFCEYWFPCKWLDPC